MSMPERQEFNEQIKLFSANISHKNFRITFYPSPRYVKITIFTKLIQKIISWMNSVALPVVYKYIRSNKFVYILWYPIWCSFRCAPQKSLTNTLHFTIYLEGSITEIQYSILIYCRLYFPKRKRTPFGVHFFLSLIRVLDIRHRERYRPDLFAIFLPCKKKN